MIAMKPTHPPVSVRMDDELYAELEEIAEQHPYFSRNRMIVAALNYWVAAVKKHGMDTHLQPLRGKG